MSYALLSPGEGSRTDERVICQAFGGNNTTGPIDVATAVRAKGGSGHCDFKSETFIAGTLNSANGQAVACRTSGNCGVMPQGDRTAALNCQSDKTEHIILQEKRDGQSLQPNGVRHTIGYANADQANAVKALRVLRKEAGEEAFFQWGLGVLACLWPQEVLRPEVYGLGLRREGVSFNGLVYLSLPRAKDGGRWPVRALWEAGCVGCPPLRWGRNKQSAEELAAYLSKLPYTPSPAQEFMCLMWQASEGDGLLRQALSAVQEVRRSACNQAEPAHRNCVRRLVPEECEALQGFPRHYTLVPYRGKPAADGPRYKALGNSMAVNVMRWIGLRIQAVDHLCRENNRGSADEGAAS